MLYVFFIFINLRLKNYCNWDKGIDWNPLLKSSFCFGNSANDGNSMIIYSCGDRNKATTLSVVIGSTVRVCGPHRPMNDSIKINKGRAWRWGLWWYQNARKKINVITLILLMWMAAQIRPGQSWDRTSALEGGGKEERKLPCVWTILRSSSNRALKKFTVVMAKACNHNTWDAEGEESGIQNQAGTHNKLQSKITMKCLLTSRLSIWICCW